MKYIKLIAAVVIIVLLVAVVLIPVLSSAKNKLGNEITTLTSSVTDVPQNKNGRILIEHNGRMIYLNDEESEIIKSIIANHPETADVVFYGGKDYTIYIEKNPFGVTNEIFYDMSKGLLGNSSTVELHGEEKEKIDSVLAGVSIRGTVPVIDSKSEK